MKTRKKRLLFLISDTGGGHRAAAQAIAKAMHQLYPDQYETHIDDVWRRHTPWPINRLPTFYSWLIGPGIVWWRILWYITEIPLLQRWLFALIAPIITPMIVAYFQERKPDLVISVHPLTNHLALRCLRTAQLTVPFVTLVTDLITFHSTWICPAVTRCIVPTPQAHRRAQGLGMLPHKLAVYGQPIDLAFAKCNLPKSAVCQKLGLASTWPTILIVGGGEGCAKIYDIARKVAQTIPRSQLIIVAGRNRTLKHRLETTVWEAPTHIFGFVDNMPDLLTAADILITKAGPSTIGEACTVGLPLLLFDYIPGQESGNIAYVQDHQIGAYAQHPADIAHLLLDWLKPGNPILQKMAQNARALAQPQAALKIAVDLNKLAKATESATNAYREHKDEVTSLRGGTTPHPYSFSEKL